jgi:hypothetical protein
MHFFIINFCHYGSGGTAVYFASSQEDQYPSPSKDLKLITCYIHLVPISANMVVLPLL